MERPRSGATGAERALFDALDAVIAGSARLAGTLGTAWRAEDGALAGAARFVRARAGGGWESGRARSGGDDGDGGAEADGDGAAADAIVGIVGGASSGKSTLFNNLVGGEQRSRVGILAHTTLGPVCAVARGRLEGVRDRVAREGVFAPLTPAAADADAVKISGEEGRLTLVGVDDPALGRSLLLDTPDFTSLAARDEGDITRALLPWLDRAIVVVDEDRWFDEQVFGWLRARLADLGVERMIVFNRCQRGGPLPEEDRQRLADQASAYGAEFAILDHHPARGPVVLGPEEVAPVAAWLSRPVDAAALRARSDAALALLGDRARGALEENDQRNALLGRLVRTLNQEASAQTRSEKRVAFEVLLSPAQRRTLDPIWQSVVRPAVWVRDKGRSLLGPVSVWRDRGAAARNGAAAADEAEARISDRGSRFFEAEVERIVGGLHAHAARSELWSRLDLPAEVPGIQAVLARAREEGPRLALRCEEAFNDFLKRFEAETRLIKGGVLTSGGATVGGVIGFIIAAAPGGLTAPVGAAVGAAIGASASAVGAQSVFRLTRLMVQTEEVKSLWRAVGAYRAGIDRLIDEGRQEILAVARDRILRTDDPLHAALRTLAARARRREK